MLFLVFTSDFAPERLDEMRRELDRLRAAVPVSADNNLAKTLEDIAQLRRQSSEAQSRAYPIFHRVVLRCSDSCGGFFFPSCEFFL